MTALIPLALLGWVPVAIVLFAMRPGWQAALIVVLGGWLFLPVGQISLPGFPDFTKETSIAIGLFAGMFLCDSRTVARLRPSAWDLPIIVWCLSAGVSSITNGNGMYDAMSSIVWRSFVWAAPYVAGRAYLGSVEGLQRWAVAVVTMALVYVPLCLYEVRMSPQFHRYVYGVHQDNFLQSRRGSTFRPMVFTHHGLELSMWLAGAALLAVSLWRAGRRLRFFGLSVGAAAGLLTFTLVAARSMGALLLFLAGTFLVMQWPTKLARQGWIAILVLVCLLVSVRATGAWNGQGLSELASTASTERAESLEYRIDCENRLLDRAQDRWLFGWSNWYFKYVRAADGHFTTVITDSLWIIAFAKNGMLGLLSILGLYIVPSLGLWARMRFVRDPTSAYLLMTIGVLMALHSVDATVNAFAYSPVLLGIGGISGLLRSLDFSKASVIPEHPAAPTWRITADTVIRPRPRTRRPASF